MTQVIQFHTHTCVAHIEHMFDFMTSSAISPCKHYCIRVYGLSKANNAVTPDHIL